MISTKEKIKPGRGIETARGGVLTFQVARKGCTRRWHLSKGLKELREARHGSVSSKCKGIEARSTWYI